MIAPDVLLSVDNLNIEFRLGQEYAGAVRDLTFELQAGETLGLAGESGCGKSTAALGIMNLLPDNGRISSGRIIFQGRDLAKLSPRQIRRVWWKEMSIVF